MCKRMTTSMNAKLKKSEGWMNIEKYKMKAFYL